MITLSVRPVIFSDLLSSGKVRVKLPIRGQLHKIKMTYLKLFCAIPSNLWHYVSSLDHL